jgi:hypothetical protein
MIIVAHITFSLFEWCQMGQSICLTRSLQYVCSALRGTDHKMVLEATQAPWPHRAQYLMSQCQLHNCLAPAATLLLRVHACMMEGRDRSTASLTLLLHRRNLTTASSFWWMMEKKHVQPDLAKWLWYDDLVVSNPSIHLYLRPILKVYFFSQINCHS